MYTLFSAQNFEIVRLQLNQEHNIPPEGKNGFRNGIEVTNGQGKTYNHIITEPYPIITKGYIETKLLPEWALQYKDSQLSKEEMVAQGYLEDV
jgi:hypothetical protein